MVLLLNRTFVPIIIASSIIFIVFTIRNISINSDYYAKRDGFENDTDRNIPGAYVKYLHPQPSNESYCNFNYGLPLEFKYQDSDINFSPELGRNGSYRILYNVVEAKFSEQAPKVTYVTHVSVNFVNYITELVRYFEGPVSVAAFVPNYDSILVLEQITQYCHCVPEMSRVSVHFVFHDELPPLQVESGIEFLKQQTCDVIDSSTLKSFRRYQKTMIYPINVCRNAARTAALTDIVMVSDIELIPSEEGATYLLPKDQRNTDNPAKYRPITCLPTLYKIITSCLTQRIYAHCERNNIIAMQQKGCSKGAMGCKEQLIIDSVICNQAHSKQRNLHMAYVDYKKEFDSVPHDWLTGLASRFLLMLQNQKLSESDLLNKGFVVPVFEINRTEQIPRRKSHLRKLISEEKAVYFHRLICSHCQKFPGIETWVDTDPRNQIEVFNVVKREVPYSRWEPIYIGTKNEPLYNEALSWEGLQDKMLQMLEMCLIGYKLVILDGAFLVHWPGIKMHKTQEKEAWREPFVNANQRQYEKILQELSKKYEANPKCKLK